MILKLLGLAFNFLKEDRNRKELVEIAGELSDSKARRNLAKKLKEEAKDMASKIAAEANRDIDREIRDAEMLRPVVQKEFEAFRSGRSAEETWGKVSKLEGYIPNGVLYDWAVFAENSGQFDVALEIYERMLTAPRICGDTVARYEALKKRIQRARK